MTKIAHCRDGRENFVEVSRTHCFTEAAFHFLERSGGSTAALLNLFSAFQIMKQLREGISGGFDEDTFGARVGFCNLRHFLELELQKRCVEPCPPAHASIDTVTRILD